jgi:hypothetical protein
MPIRHLVSKNVLPIDVAAEYTRLAEAGLQTVMPPEDHPWSDKSFSVLDPLGNSVYIYSVNRQMNLNNTTSANRANHRQWLALPDSRRGI